MILVCIFFTFENLSPFTLIVWKMTATPFSCETPAVICGLENFQLTFHQHEAEKIMTNFHFWVNFPFNVT